ncbi:endophilin-B1 isoform X1 [Nilaparvata lugens]|uniref:endophilin-B1 isoform X1 n=1 Tax=Nilaparvata lugens TaxID=108931 RepID=UPI00193CD7F3|nr:endophilin-B1 isoform X1 [Nilaparvata lugens]
MIEAGNDFGPGTSYGSALIKVGQCEQRIGAIEKEFIASANHCFLSPLRKFLDGEMKTILKERGLLESKRLDLDACKSRVRKARSMLGQPPNKDGLSPEFLLDQAERDLRVAQSEYDRQAEITKLLLEGVNSSHASHLRSLHEFVDAQVTYYERCHHTMQQLKAEMQSLSGAPPASASSASFLHSSNHVGSQGGQGGPVTPPGATASPSGGQRARVLCDYDAKDQSELSLMTDEVITVFKIPESEDYLMGERGTQRGKVPAVFVEFLN